MKPMKEKWIYAVIAWVVCMTACQGKKAPEQEAPVDTVIEIVEEGNEYERVEVPNSTSAEVAAWLQTISMDSIERLLCRHNGKVVTPDGKTLHVFITDVLSSRPEDAMNYPFKEAADSLYIGDHISTDGRVRIIDWNTGMGGTCPDNARYTLLRGDDGRIHSQGKNHGEEVVIRLYQLQDNKGRTIYLTHDYFRGSSVEGSGWVAAWCIQGDTLSPVKVFPRGEVRVGTGYGIPDWYFKTNNGEGWDWLFEMVGRNLYVPITDSLQSLTDRYNLYRWKGDHFDLMGVVGNRRLHITLKDYVALEQYFVTKDYRVRIDLLADGSLRYASWKRNKQTDSPPDLVIKGGRYEENRGYVFENDGYYYRVTTTESRKQLIVEKDGRTVLCQNIE